MVMNFLKIFFEDDAQIAVESSSYGSNLSVVSRNKVRPQCLQPHSTRFHGRDENHDAKKHRP